MARSPALRREELAIKAFHTFYSEQPNPKAKGEARFPERKNL